MNQTRLIQHLLRDCVSSCSLFEDLLFKRLEQFMLIRDAGHLNPQFIN